MQKLFTDPARAARALAFTLSDVAIPGLPAAQVGKVRQSYDLDAERRLMVATDRLSAFDLNLTTVPLKGQVLTELSRFWFERTRHICPNHLIAVPDPNVTVCRRLTMLPVEVVVRGYLTGSTNTSLLTMYRHGARRLYGHAFPDGMRDNQRLAAPVITPTTKGDHGAHDEPLGPDDVARLGLVDADTWARTREHALALFAFVAVVIGGMGNLVGAVVGGFLIGIVLTMLQAYLPPDLRAFRDAFAFAVVILVLLVRPSGLIPARNVVERV